MPSWRTVNNRRRMAALYASGFNEKFDHIMRQTAFRVMDEIAGDAFEKFWGFKPGGYVSKGPHDTDSVLTQLSPAQYWDERAGAWVNSPDAG